jgi:hypothetical protein
MVVDYEQAWIRLGELIASKPHHGSKDLTLAMAEIASECRIPGGTLSRLLRLYGVEVEMDRLADALRDVDPQAGGGSAASGMDPAAAIANNTTQEVNDGSRDEGRAGAGAGAHRAAAAA